MNAGKLITNLQAILGMVPNTIRTFSNSEYGLSTIPFSFSGKRYKTDSVPFEIKPEQMSDILRTAPAPTHLLLKEFSSKSEFYVYNVALKAFLGKDGLFYPIDIVCDECKYDSLKAANKAVSSVYSVYNQSSFVIYERMQAEYFNGHKIDATLIDSTDDNANVIYMGEEHPIYKWLTIVNGLLDEGYIPNYSKIQLLSNQTYQRIKDLDNRGCWTAISEAEVESIKEYLMNIIVQEGSHCKPMTVSEYIRGLTNE